MYENKSFNRNPANHALYHALMKALIDDENAMDKGVSYIGKKTKRRRTKESESSKKTSTTKETSKGKALKKSSKTGKSASAKEPVEEPIIEVVMDDAVHTAGEDVVRDDEQPQDTSEPKINKTPNQDWFKQPPRPPTPDSEWNKRQVVLDQPEQSWFNQMVSATNGPLTFNDLMATLIEFSKSEKPKKNNESTRGNKRSYNGMMTHEISIVVKKANVDAHGFVVHGVLSGLLIFAGTTLFMIGFNREQEGIKGYGYREEVVVLFCKLTMLHSKELASPKQTALELDYFGATANELDIRIDNEEKLGEDASKQGRIDDADAEATFIDETLNDARNKNNNISNNN
ncbi:hypothetical protein Tco_1081067 [Tanacetum coccineum]|uniref:Uncharacterized protein n=1 Tax=Tanacetum coccineum TaxID=301880 RepID=A0ABQ5HWG2_9ASTR